MLNQFDSTGKRIWGVREMQAIAKRYLSGKTQVEAAAEIGISQQAVSKLYDRVSDKILKIDLRNNVSHWYNGSGITKANAWQVSRDSSARLRVASSAMSD